MHPIFFKTNPMMLLNEGKYQFMGFILSNEINQEFNNSLNKSYKDLHVSTGKQCGVCVFDIPPKTWLEKYFKWLLEKYSNSALPRSEESDFLMDFLSCAKSINKDVYNDFKDYLIQSNCSSEMITQRDLLAKNFNISSHEFPSFVLIDNKNYEMVILKNITIESISFLIEEATSNLRINRYEKIKFSKEIAENLEKNISNLSEKYYDAFLNLADIFIIQNNLKNQINPEPVEELIKKYPEFKKIAVPDKFYWDKSLIKCLERYRNLITHYVEGINLLESKQKNNGIDLKEIKGKMRFRVTNKFRAIYTERDNIKVHQFLGEHDLGLRKF